jgi:hypothetical protein
MSINLDLTHVIAYLIYFIVTGIGAFILKEIKKMREDKNSFYAKQLEFVAQQQEALKTKLGQEEYNHAKEVAQDIIYKVEQLGKELAWDAVTKHSKATEWISQATSLNDEQIFDIVKSTIGLINAKKQKA